MFRTRLAKGVLPVVVCAAFGLSVSLQRVQSQDDPVDSRVADANAMLHAVGGLGVGHIQSTLGLIGVTADAFAKDVYTAKQVEDLMTGTVNGIEAVKKLLRRLQEADLTEDDKEYIDRMVSVYNALQREAKALVTFAKTRKASDADAFDAARKSALGKLAQLTEPVPPAPEAPPAALDSDETTPPTPEKPEAPAKPDSPAPSDAP